MDDAFAEPSDLGSPGEPAGMQADAATNRTLDLDRIADLYRELLKLLGHDPSREGLRDTPARVAAWWSDFMDVDSNTTPRTFADTSANGQFILVTGIDIWSLCEHHLLPFNVQFSVGYVARDVILGLSKFVRLTRSRAATLQVQERLTREIAADITSATGSPDVAIVGVGEHLCMSMRGVRSQSVRTTTEHLTGAFRDDPYLMQRFLAAVTSSGPGWSR